MAFAFSEHLALFTEFLGRRQESVEKIESTLLNVRGKEASRRSDRPYFEQLLNACFFGLPGLPREMARLKGQSAAMLLSDGFEPMNLERNANELDPLQLVARAHHHWESHRWPGKSGRLAYAENVHAVFLLRELERLSLRIWDDGAEPAGGRLVELQRLLDSLNAPAHPSALIRDVRWVIPTAQGPVTRHLLPYFTVADRVTASFDDPTRLGLHVAGAKLAGGHLRSQLRYRSWTTGRPIDDPENLAITRASNSMDGGLLVGDLVPLLKAYQAAWAAPDRDQRLALADAILQGLSADPELLLARLDLLTPHLMIEDLFLEWAEDGCVRHTPMGEARLELLHQYGELVAELAGSLREDAWACDPVRHAYSPYGIAYGFVADLLSNMGADALLSQPSFELSLEDMFDSRGRLEDKAARARGWEKLPRREGEREHFLHSAEFAGLMFERLTTALEARARHGAEPNASDVPSRRLFVVPRGAWPESLTAGTVPEGIVLADEYCFTSDWQRALGGRTTGSPKSEILGDRKEARYLASVESDGKWIGVSKVVLTLVTGQGRDALLTDLPPSAVDVLRLTCPGLITQLADAPGESG